MVMCAKCPFECELESDMRKHLNAHHGINDGGKGDTDKAVITKSNISFLPFKQCLCTPTRCLSYAVSD